MLLAEKELHLLTFCLAKISFKFRIFLTVNNRPLYEKTKHLCCLLWEHWYFYFSLPYQDLVYWLRNNFLLGLLGITFFSFAHVIIRLSAFSAVVHLLHTLQKQYDFRKKEIFNIFFLRWLSEIKPPVSAKQNKYCPVSPVGLAKRHSYFTSCSSSIPDVNSSQLQILVNETDGTFPNSVLAPLAQQPSCLVQNSLCHFWLQPPLCRVAWQQSSTEISNSCWMQTLAFD